ncbi:serine/threonine protein kinase [Candidatus Galacturonibacter soehngenii]|uniref:serine/threonine protein kinase n=1 Tax=Candidatus Galacturonatibacter soehngenii TaxID=2307010 RepID=UPI001781D481|nr:serine/threonine-protein kinase [Candidatus Galacturonibacter soehngenii]
MKRSWFKLNNHDLFALNETKHRFSLYDRYRIERQIGCGLSGKVYLAEHIKLGAKRVIKCVSKKESMYQQFLAEATLLKNLTHPGIPVIYDLEEDEEYLYIIEEYIEGESLKAIMLDQKAISRESAIHIIIQICDIIEYLHNIRPYPVLYLDLKPDHIIVCNDCVKIIDFGAAIYMEKEEVDYSFGTPSFAAPEQFYSLKLDPKADIYAIGSILYFMLIGKKPSQSNSKKSKKNEFLSISQDLKKIILKCMAKNPQNRYDNVAQIKKDLSICKNKKNTLIISILGSQSRIGVSHIAIGMVSFLNKNGIKAIYEEKNKSEIVSNIKDINAHLYHKDGIYYFKNFIAVPNYNETISINKSDFEVIVRDCGTFHERSSDYGTADIRLVVLGTKEWEYSFSKECMEAMNDNKSQYLFNMCGKGQAYKAAQYLGIKRGYHVPFFTDPFVNNGASEKAFKHMLKGIIHVKRRMLFKR